MPKLLKQIAAVIVFALIIFAGVYYYLAQKLTQESREFIDVTKSRMSLFADVSYESLSGNPFTNFITIKGFKIIPKLPIGGIEPINIQKITYKYTRDANTKAFLLLVLNIEGIETTLHTRNFADKASKNPYMQDFLLGLDERKLLVDFNLEERYDANLKKLMLKSQLNLHGLFQTSFGIMLGNFDFKNLLNRQKAQEIVLQQFRIQYNDDSMVPELLNTFARDKNMKKIEIVAELQKNLDATIALTQDPRLINSLQQIKLFINHPNQLSLDSFPKTSMTFESMKQLAPMELFDRLNIVVKAQ